MLYLGIQYRKGGPYPIPHGGTLQGPCTVEGGAAGHPFILTPLQYHMPSPQPNHRRMPRERLCPLPSPLSLQTILCGPPDERLGVLFSCAQGFLPLMSLLKSAVWTHVFKYASSLFLLQHRVHTSRAHTKDTKQRLSTLPLPTCQATTTKTAGTRHLAQLRQWEPRSATAAPAFSPAL